ncbi:hypothetical protein RF679_16345 [Undibacterium cyanobacteriorum]|uniref:DUF3185 domain-containing protein n=1 Tax=Undibacterium cyanobacteriorum TaxID=3073561 RepID=A0ABY9RG59_9BURK|nr:hypothetical protein [Undibacterium sp. 20NA77.5]WMW80204.1 hypothetical protein RF679_16345 [Undibacterium sp. 20NA77.5]
MEKFLLAKKLIALGFAVLITAIIFVAVLNYSTDVLNYFFTISAEEMRWWKGTGSILMIGGCLMLYRPIWRGKK